MLDDQTGLGQHTRVSNASMPSGRTSRVIVCGSSISMLVRPSVPLGIAYPAMLEAYLNTEKTNSWLVVNHSRIAGTVEDTAATAADIVADQPEAVILHHGYNEALRRPHGRRVWYFEHMYRPPRPGPVAKVRQISRRFSAVRSGLGLTQHWVSEERFRAVMTWLVDYLASETHARIILLGLTPWSQKIARYAPDSESALRRFDRAMQDVAELSGADYIPFRKFVAAAQATASEIAPDGTHFSALGHAAVARVLADVL